MNSLIRFVLVDTSHPGNIGAAARAMKTMGLNRLYLVSPKNYPSVEATARATGADDILDQAIVCDSLTDAISDCQFILATSARDRTIQIPAYDVQAAATKIKAEITNSLEIAVIFGRERSGLTNEELQHCHGVINIPSEESFSSLNLAAAVQIVAYELKMTGVDTIKKDSLDYQLASSEHVEGFLQHLEQVMIQLNFQNNKQSETLKLRLRRLFMRSRLAAEEVHILRGLLSAIEKKL